MRMLLLLAVPSIALANPLEFGAPNSDNGLDRPGIAIDKRDEPAGIINGEDADSSDYPMTGGMLMDAHITFGSQGGDIRLFLCSSTLIAPDVVLIAAHCVDPESLNASFTYNQGTTTVNDMYWTRQADLTDYDGSNPNEALPDDVVHVREAVFHEDFSIFALQTGLSENHDIALLFLDEPVEDVPYAYLPSPDEAEQIEEGLEVEVVGWGQQIATSGTQTPPAGSIQIKQMGSSVISQVSDYEIKIGEVQSDVRKCHGDSGGPTFLNVDTEATIAMRQIGITSHAYDQTDCNETGGVDTRVDHYRDWIEDQLKTRCEDGSRVWCVEKGIPLLPFDEDEDGIIDSREDEDEDGILDFEDPEVKTGCGCATGSNPGVTWVGAFAAAAFLAQRRRRVDA